ncbi:MAG: hypothetical protein D6759_05015 [Chloroflexi bacterium]|nr:MAG: hypothetical protein D6759_05015 [Chloroflexota bacterium]
MSLPSGDRHTFIVRIWWEPGLTRPGGHPLWRGYVQHVVNGRSIAFQSLEELLRFIQSQTGSLEPEKAMDEDKGSGCKHR